MLLTKSDGNLNKLCRNVIQQLISLEFSLAFGKNYLMPISIDCHFIIKSLQRQQHFHYEIIYLVICLEEFNY